MVVKPLSHRQRQAASTRRAVAEAARMLFAEHGYTATTIESVSSAAGIPVQTIYSAFGSKRAILEDIRRAWIEEADVVAEHRRAMTLPALSDRLDAVAHWTRRQFELGHDVVAAYQEAARTDSAAAEVWRRALAGREVGLRDLLTSAGGLAEGLTVDRALEAVVALTLPEAYRYLVAGRHWTPDEYERWLGRCLRNALMPPRATIE
jgi:AcrR family transcriptional regulator